MVGEMVFAKWMGQWTERNKIPSTNG